LLQKKGAIQFRSGGAGRVLEYDGGDRNYSTSQ